MPRIWDTSDHNRGFPSGVVSFHRSRDKHSCLPTPLPYRHGPSRHLGLRPFPGLFQPPDLPVLFRLLSALSVPPFYSGLMSKFFMDQYRGFRISVLTIFPFMVSMNANCSQCPKWAAYMPAPPQIMVPDPQLFQGCSRLLLS